MTDPQIKARIADAVENAYAAWTPTRQSSLADEHRVVALAAAREALADLLERLDNSEGYYDAVFFVVKDMLAHLTEQEQTDGTGVRETVSASAGGDPVGDSAVGVVPELAGRPHVALPSEVETLLKEGPKAAEDMWFALPLDVKAGLLPTGGLDPIYRLASALRASETAKQQAEQRADRLQIVRDDCVRSEVDLLARLKQAEQERDHWKYRHTADMENYRLALELRTKNLKATEASLAQREAEITRQVEQAFKAGWQYCDDDTDRDGEHINHATSDSAFAAYLKAQTGSETP